MYVLVSISAQALAHGSLHGFMPRLVKCRKIVDPWPVPDDVLRRCDPTRELPSDLQACLGNTVVAFGTYT